MKTSARNQLQGTVTAIHPGAVNATVEISLNDHDRLSAMITMDSLAEMKLGPGSEVMALIKAPSVLIVLDDPTIKLSARNSLRGTVARITRWRRQCRRGAGAAGGTHSERHHHQLRAWIIWDSRSANRPVRCSRPAA